MTTTNVYQTTKHLFEPFPNDSVTCRYCQGGVSSDVHSNVPTQPILDAGEWRVFKHQRKRILDSTGCLVAETQTEAQAVQIVADHTRVAKSVDVLIAAREQIVFLSQALEDFHGTQPPNPVLAQIDAALATTTQSDAGEGQ
jgi:hypothetical protein